MAGVEAKAAESQVTILQESIPEAGVLRGMGDAGPNGGPAGDLYVYINVKPHKYVCTAGL
jgi:DnaJ-class molecular chaperone